MTERAGESMGFERACEHIMRAAATGAVFTATVSATESTAKSEKRTRAAAAQHSGACDAARA